MSSQTPAEEIPDARAWALIDLMLEFERGLSAVPPQDVYDLEFYELLYQTAARIGPTDAFYVCLYDEVDKTIYFPCNWEGDFYETCDIKPLGHRPTSWAIRNRKTYIPELDGVGIQHNANRFGDASRPSQSAIHTPMLTVDGRGGSRLWGVLSMQSYRPGVYDSWTVRVFEWLACRAAAAFQRDRDLAEARTGEHSWRLQEQANEFNKALKEITRQAHDLYSALGAVEKTAARSAAAALCRTCYQSQSRAVIHAYQPSPASAEAKEADDPFLPLTRQERRVLVLLSHHRTYTQIAIELSIEASTVKSHVK